MALSQNYALDSQCFTYLVNTLQDIVEPTDDLAIEKKALIQSFLYSGGWHFITPTVDEEWRKIKETNKRKLHENWNSVHFGTLHLWSSDQTQAVEDRANVLFPHHKKMADCKVLAEAEILGAAKLLSYDTDFVDRLCSHSQIELVRPSDHWKSMNIKTGASPKVVPTNDNPISEVCWWRV